ncbi:MAG: hypothetical protein ACJ8AW_50675 [Rhodopila sp.]
MGAPKAHHVRFVAAKMDTMGILGIKSGHEPGWLAARLVSMGLTRAQFAALLTTLGAEGEAGTIAKRLRRWDAAEAPPTDEVLALLTLLGRVRGVLGDVCGPIQTRRRR